MNWNKAIKVDPKKPPKLSSSPEDDFSTVTVYLLMTDELANALKEVEPYPNYDHVPDELYVGLSKFTDTGMDGCLFACIRNEIMELDLDEEDEIEIWAALNPQCLKTYGKGCQELLQSAGS